MSLQWKLDIQRDANNKAVSVEGTTSVGAAQVKAVVKPASIEVTFAHTLNLTDAEPLTELAKVLTDLQNELRDGTK